MSLPKGKWRFDDNDSFGAMIFQIVHTARQMGITVYEFLQLPQDEKAIQLVYSNIMSKIEQANAQEKETQMKKKPSK